MDYINESLYNEIISDSNVISGKEYRDLICAISQVATDTVVKTLGPYGSTSLIDEGTGFTYPTKDGWTCLNKLQFTDPTYNTLYNMLKKISFNSVTTVGDGTTTAMVVANNFLREIYTTLIPKIEEHSGFRQADFIESMNYIYELLTDNLLKNPNVQRINLNGDFSDIYKIAYIATNGNSEFASIIQNIYKETSNPNIQISMEKQPKTTYEIQKGYKFDARVLKYSAYVNSDSGYIEYDKNPCKVVIFDHNVTFQQHEKIIGSLSSLAGREGYEIIIMAPYFDDIITSWIDSSIQKILQNRQRPNIMLIQVPVVMDFHRKTLADLAVLTNSQVFDDGKVKAFNILYHNQTHDEKDKIDDPLFNVEGYMFKSPEDVLNACLGTSYSLVLTKTEGFLRDYESIVPEALYSELILEAENEYNALKDKAHKIVGGTLDKEFLFKQMRYIKLKGCTGIIKVGALTDIQQRCDKDTLDDAILACRSAYENGYVRGMNLEIMTIINSMLKSHDFISTLNAQHLYAEDILHMLYNAFYFTSLRVIENKHPNGFEKRLINVYQPYTDPEIEKIHKEIGERVANKCQPSHDSEIGKVYKYTKFNFTNHEVLDTAIIDSNMFDYNLRQESMEPKGRWNVINSTSTDIEILRAVINVLTTVITSNQFISLTHRFDPVLHNERKLSLQMKEDSRIIQNKVQSIIDTLKYNNINIDSFFKKESINKNTVFEKMQNGENEFYIAMNDTALYQSTDTESPVVAMLDKGSYIQPKYLCTVKRGNEVSTWGYISISNNSKEYHGYIKIS